ncbi:RNase P subunit p30 family protein [Halobacterium litoreum]|uniref:Ribonuclease P protein component 3 n=1 Tax=Halobacterium litoreum TaxID=2039234 RepID=A0ABD5NBQ9_9EURY|nr:RNase P subunit p30 family protein [Halobacterium litoreum]UHH14481.1 ribonuclease P [Halobacterium litoreum]
MYEAVFAHPDGDSTVARFAATAASDGYDGVVVRSRHGSRPDVDYAAVAEEYDIDVVEGVEVVAEDRSQASGTVGSIRESVPLLAVRGGTPDMNRFVAESPKVDVLAAPMQGRGDVNHVIVKAAKRNGVRLEFDLSGVLRKDGGARVQALRGLRKLRELVAYYDAPFVVSARAASHLELRAPRELLAVGETIGFDRGQIRSGLEEWGALAARNRELLSGEFIAPGVETGEHEEDA